MNLPVFRPVATNAWGRPIECSECGAPLPRHKAGGRPRVLCEARECRNARERRRRALLRAPPHVSQIQLPPELGRVAEIWNKQRAAG